MAIDVRGMVPVLEVFDMSTSIAFYRDIRGFQIASTSRPGPDFAWASLTLNGVELMLNTAYDEGERPPQQNPARVAAHHDTCLYFGCEDVDEAYAHLLANNIPAKEPTIAPYGMRQLYVSDPDGYNLCFQWPASQQMKDDWQARYGMDAGTANGEIKAS
jgi:glyoxylase I family protein